MDLIIGLGETGSPLYNVLRAIYPNTIGIDKKQINTPVVDGMIRFINICIPYSNRFVDIVKEYQNIYEPFLTIIHSTVPIGTTSHIPNAVHSPILGRHNEMEEDIKKYQKWIGGEKAAVAADYLSHAGIRCRLVDMPEITEALKLMCLAKYGMSIAFAHYQKEIADKLNFPYEEIVAWDLNYNRNVDKSLQRPIIKLEDKKIGGHCVIQNTELLNKQYPNQILDEILRYK